MNSNIKYIIYHDLVCFWISNKIIIRYLGFIINIRYIYIMNDKFKPCDIKVGDYLVYKYIGDTRDDTGKVFVYQKSLKVLKITQIVFGSLMFVFHFDGYILTVDENNISLDMFFYRDFSLRRKDIISNL